MPKAQSWLIYQRFAATSGRENRPEINSLLRFTGPSGGILPSLLLHVFPRTKIAQGRRRLAVGFDGRFRQFAKVVQ